MADHDEYLKRLYYSADTGLISAPRLYRKAREAGRKITRKQVEAFVNRQSLAQQYRVKRKHYFPIYAETPGSYQMDLMFYPDSIKRFNSGYGTFMTAVEVTTRKGHCIKMKNKSTPEVLRAFKEFLQQAGTVRALTTDNGSEWISHEFRTTCILPNKIDHRVAETGDHSRMGMIESFNRTIKRLIDKFRSAYSTKVFHTYLPKLMANYNSSVHSSIGCSPDQCAASSEHQEGVRRKARERSQQMTKSVDLKIGDSVRVIIIKKNQFGKETKSWSDEIYQITGDSPMKTSFTINDESSRRWKHYELNKVGAQAESNPYKRKVEPGDLEQHLATMERQGRARNDDSRVEQPETRPGNARTEPQEDAAAAGRIAALQKQYVGRTFRDGGTTWKICSVRHNLRVKAPMAYYYDVTKHSSTPAAKQQERTPLSELEDHAEWVRPGEQRVEPPAAAEASRLNQKRAIQPGRFVFIKNHQADFTRRNVGHPDRSASLYGSRGSGRPVAHAPASE